MKFIVEQHKYRVGIRWNYGRFQRWVISKNYTYDAPPIIERAEVSFHAAPSGPLVSDSIREYARRWELAAKLCGQLDEIFRTVDDFSDVTLDVDTDAISASHFTTEGRKDSKRRVTIHVAF